MKTSAFLASPVNYLFAAGTRKQKENKLHPKPGVNRYNNAQQSNDEGEKADVSSALQEPQQLNNLCSFYDKVLSSKPHFVSPLPQLVPRLTPSSWS